ncbi:conserved hypothetical protein [Culex quinquefasciatus]|uniref:Uncharacterized protein n=1 Tax=Culex quinquefasciatus TaxID=7176 RepID=B0WYE6_CULQU|nr:conserved hypothetical protein [Culex quinquefasciatus]|eukprot:XP_001862418.1 conserved hypothetical protein [Culex quinquefasciatus]
MQMPSSFSKDFYYRDFVEFDITLYFRNCILGARRYLLKQKDEDIPKALAHQRRLRVLDFVCKLLLTVGFLYMTLIKLDMIGFLLHSTSYKTSYPLSLERV